VTTEGLRGWGIVICAALALGLIGAVLLQMSHPAWGPWNWVGIVGLGAVLVLMWESTKKIGDR